MREIAKDFIVLGEVIKNRFKNSENIKIFGEDYEEGIFELRIKDIDANGWYQLINDKGNFILTEVELVSFQSQLNDWL